MLPIRQTVRLSLGHVTLHAWPAATEQGHLLDLLTLTLTLAALRDAEGDWSPEDVEPGIWQAFTRLLDASTPERPPGPLTWPDVITLLDAMWELNDVEETAKKQTGLTRRAGNLLERLQRQAEKRQKNSKILAPRTTRSTST